jgi:hypothetical protein
MGITPYFTPKRTVFFGCSVCSRLQFFAGKEVRSYLGVWPRHVPGYSILMAFYGFINLNVPGIAVSMAQLRGSLQQYSYSVGRILNI